MKDNLLGRPSAAGDNLAFLRLRWVLFAWMLTDVGLHYGAESFKLYCGAGLVLAFAISQALLWKMPPRYLSGLKLHYLVFIMDLNFVLLTLISMDQASSELLIVLFLTLFITALAQKVSLAMLASVVVMLVYLGFRTRTAQGFQIDNAMDLLDLPFILIVGLHASVVVSEANFHMEITEALAQDNKALSAKLGATSKGLSAASRTLSGGFDAVPAPALLLDAEGQVCAFNSRAEQLFGAKRRTVIEKPIREIPMLEPLRILLLRKGTDELNEGAWLPLAKGGRFYAWLRSGISRDEEGRLQSIAVFFSPQDAPPEPEPVAVAASVAEAEAGAADAAPEKPRVMQQSLAAEVDPEA